MKARTFSKGILLALLIFPVCQKLAAQDEHTKEFHKEYSAEKGSQVLLINKYGNIDVKDWTDNKVKIDVTVIVKHSNAEKAKKMLDNIFVNISQNGNQIKAETEIDDKFGLSNWNDDNNFEINYVVHMPKELDLELSNKYGNVFISEISGYAKIDVKYGKLMANKIMRGNVKPLSEVNLAYSNGSTITQTDWLKLNIKYSKLTIEKATAIVQYSQYSKTFIDEISSLVVESKYDNFEIGRISNLVITAGYSDMEILQLSKKIEAETRYSDFEIGQMPADFESISINSRYGTFKIGLDASASYKIDGKASYAKIYYPDSGRVSRIQENNSMTVSGNVGKEPNPSATVKIETSYGSVRLNL